VRGTIGIVVGIVIIALGLGGLGLALTNLMITGHPESALVPVSGLVVFVVSCLVLVVVAYRS
jgi:hypothetical protein